MKIVIVKFLDPTTHSQWASLEAIDETEPHVCYAHGRLMQEDDKVVKVSLLTGGDKQSGADWVDIPAGCVLSVDVIKEVDWGD